MNQTQVEKMLAIAKEIVTTIEVKDKAYGSSWMAHGGFSAFFNLDRKYSRVENMAAEQNYDLFAAMEIYPDGPDALKDLIAYALLTLTEKYDPPGWADGEPGREYVDQDRE